MRTWSTMPSCSSTSGAISSASSASSCLRLSRRLVVLGESITASGRTDNCYVSCQLGVWIMCSRKAALQRCSIWLNKMLDIFLAFQWHWLALLFWYINRTVSWMSRARRYGFTPTCFLQQPLFLTNCIRLGWSSSAVRLRIVHIHRPLSRAIQQLDMLQKQFWLLICSSLHSDFLFYFLLLLTWGEFQMVYSTGS